MQSENRDFDSIDKNSEKELDGASTSTMSLVDWRWAARNGFWIKREKKWNPLKGGFEEYLKQRKLCSSRRAQKSEGKGKKPSTDAVSSSQIFRPFSTDMVMAVLSESQTLLNDSDSRRFMCTPLQRYWSFGYQLQGMRSIFDSLPTDLVTAMQAWVSALQRTSLPSNAISSSAGLVNASCAAAAPSTAIEGLSTVTVTMAHGVPTAEDRQLLRMLEDETAAGAMHVWYDAETQQKSHTAVTPRYASLLGLHAEEFLARVSRRDLPLMFHQLDLLAIMLYDMAHERCDTVEVYQRARRGESQESLLIHSIRRKVFNTRGRVVQVKFQLEVVTPEEYDAAVATSPHHCPLLLVGDRRSGQKLLDDSAADIVIGLRGMLLNPSCAAALRQMARRVAELAADAGNF